MVEIRVSLDCTRDIVQISVSTLVSAQLHCFPTSLFASVFPVPATCWNRVLESGGVGSTEQQNDACEKGMRMFGENPKTNGNGRYEVRFIHNILTCKNHDFEGKNKKEAFLSLL